MKTVLGAIISCFITVHSPDGKDETFVEYSHIFVIRPLAKRHEEHVAPGTRTILYVDGRAIGVRETPEEISAMIKDCEK